MLGARLLDPRTAATVVGTPRRSVPRPWHADRCCYNSAQSWTSTLSSAPLTRAVLEVGMVELELEVVLMKGRVKVLKVVVQSR